MSNAGRGDSRETAVNSQTKSSSTSSSSAAASSSQSWETYDEVGQMHPFPLQYIRTCIQTYSQHLYNCIVPYQYPLSKPLSTSLSPTLSLTLISSNRSTSTLIDVLVTLVVFSRLKWCHQQTQNWHKHNVWRHGWSKGEGEWTLLTCCHTICMTSFTFTFTYHFSRSVVIGHSFVHYHMNLLIHSNACTPLPPLPSPNAADRFVHPSLDIFNFPNMGLGLVARGDPPLPTAHDIFPLTPLTATIQLTWFYLIVHYTKFLNVTVFDISKVFQKQ